MSVAAGSKRGLRAETEGELEPGRTQIDRDHVVVAAVDEGRDGRQTDRAAAEDAHTVPRAHVGLLGGVHAHREGLGERRHVERQVLGHRVQPTPVDLGDQEERGETTLGRAVADAAELVVAGLHHDAVADADAPDVGTDPVDHAGDLVAETHRLGAGSGESAQADVRQVAAADAAHAHAHHRVARTGCGLGHVVDARVARAVHSHLQHRVLLRP